MKNITIAGTGVLGAQIAFQTAYSGYNVTVYDISDKILEKAKTNFSNLAEKYQANLNASQEKLEVAFANLSYSSDLKTAVADADLLIEAIPENIDIKTDFYTKLATVAPEKTVFATNTSTLLPSAIAPFTGRPERFLAMHFSNEIWPHNLAEIMGHSGTDPKVFDQIVEFAKSIGMVPIPIYTEQPGYVTNSLFLPWAFAAIKLWAGGVTDMETIDKVWMIATGTKYLPFATLDTVGMNTIINGLTAMNQNLKDPVIDKAIKLVQEDYIDKGKLGKLVGEGFYKYPNPAFEDESFLLG